jgi:phosphohistidine phosphatase SixA
MDRYVECLEGTGIAARRFTKAGGQVELTIEVDAERIGRWLAWPLSSPESVLVSGCVRILQ